MNQTESKPVSKLLSPEFLPKRRILTVSERESLQQAVNVYGYAEAAQMGRFIPGSQGASPVDVPWINVNRPRLNAQQKQVMQTLKEGTPPPLSAEEKDKLKKWTDEVRELVTDPKWFQSREETRVLRRDNPAYFRAMEKAQKWQKPQDRLKGMVPQTLAETYRNAMRMLEPEDPNADSLDKLRKDR